MCHYAWFVKRRLQAKIVIKLEQHQGGERGFLGFFFGGGGGLLLEVMQGAGEHLCGSNRDI